jgi:hypothetical protein
VVGAKAKEAGAVIKSEANVIKSDVRERTANMVDDSTLGYVKRQSRVSERKAERTKRIAARNDTGRVISQSQPETLDRRKRVAREQIIAGFSDNTLKGKTRREINKIADSHRKEIMSRPQTDAEKERRDSKLQSRAIIGNTGSGAGSKSGPSASQMQNVCPVTATNGGMKGSCAPAKISSKEMSAMPVKNSQAATIMNTKSRNLSIGSSKKK